MKIVITHVEEFEFEERLDGSLVEPKCPECNVGVDRPKCPWEMGGGCARHEILDAYRQAQRQLLKEQGHIVVVSSNSGEEYLTFKCESPHCRRYPLKRLIHFTDEVWEREQIRFRAEHPVKGF